MQVDTWRVLAVRKVREGADSIALSVVEEHGNRVGEGVYTFFLAHTVIRRIRVRAVRIGNDLLRTHVNVVMENRRARYRVNLTAVMLEGSVDVLHLLLIVKVDDAERVSRVIFEQY